MRKLGLICVMVFMGAFGSVLTAATTVSNVDQATAALLNPDADFSMPEAFFLNSAYTLGSLDTPWWEDVIPGIDLSEPIEFMYNNVMWPLSLVLICLTVIIPLTKGQLFDLGDMGFRIGILIIFLTGSQSIFMVLTLTQSGLTTAITQYMKDQQNQQLEDFITSPPVHRNVGLSDALDKTNRYYVSGVISYSLFPMEGAGDNGLGLVLDYNGGVVDNLSYETYQYLSSIGKSDKTPPATMASKFQSPVDARGMVFQDNLNYIFMHHPDMRSRRENSLQEVVNSISGVSSIFDLGYDNDADGFDKGHYSDYQEKLEEDYAEFIAEKNLMMSTKEVGTYLDTKKKVGNALSKIPMPEEPSFLDKMLLEMLNTASAAINKFIPLILVFFMGMMLKLQFIITFLAIPTILFNKTERIFKGAFNSCLMLTFVPAVGTTLITVWSLFVSSWMAGGIGSLAYIETYANNNSDLFIGGLITNLIPGVALGSLVFFVILELLGSIFLALASPKIAKNILSGVGVGGAAVGAIMKAGIGAAVMGAGAFALGAAPALGMANKGAGSALSGLRRGASAVTRRGQEESSGGGDLDSPSPSGAPSGGNTGGPGLPGNSSVIPSTRVLPSTKQAAALKSAGLNQDSRTLQDQVKKRSAEKTANKMNIESDPQDKSRAQKNDVGSATTEKTNQNNKTLNSNTSSGETVKSNFSKSSVKEGVDSSNTRSPDNSNVVPQSSNAPSGAPSGGNTGRSVGQRFYGGVKRYGGAGVRGIGSVAVGATKIAVGSAGIPISKNSNTFVQKAGVGLVGFAASGGRPQALTQAAHSFYMVDRFRDMSRKREDADSNAPKSIINEMDSGNTSSRDDDIRRSKALRS